MRVNKQVISTIKIIVDTFMLILFFLLMGYHLFDNVKHEWFGASVFFLFVLHNALNWRWYKNLFRGRYNRIRIEITAVNLLLWIFMIMNVTSAIMISRVVFAPLNLVNGSVGRRMHLFSTSWTFLFISFHFGMHTGMFVGIFKKHIKLPEETIKCVKLILRVLIFALSIYGVVVLVQREIYKDLFFITEFKFLDFDEPKIKFFFDYFSIFTLFSSLGTLSLKTSR